MSALVVLVLLLAVVGPLVLYFLVRSEHDQRREMSRSEAERTARRDTRDDRTGDRSEDDHKRGERGERDERE